MDIDPTYTDISFDGVGVRNSQKRLKSLIADLAIQPLRQKQDALLGQFELVESIVMKRIAAVIVYWAQNKHDPVVPHIKNQMGDITNGTKNNVSLEEFYLSEVKYAMYSLAPSFDLKVPERYEPDAEELEFALLNLEENTQYNGRLIETPLEAAITNDDLLAQTYGLDEEDDYDEDDFYAVEEYDDYDDHDDEADLDDDDDEVDEPEPEQPKPRFGFGGGSSFGLGSFSNAPRNSDPEERDVVVEDKVAVDLSEANFEEDLAGLAELVGEEEEQEIPTLEAIEQQTAIVSSPQSQVVEVEKPEINLNVLNITAEHAWQLIYGLIGYRTEYIQDTMIPRWRQNPQDFEKDRRFLYGILMDSLRNASGMQHIAGNYLFADQKTTVDQLWQHYYRDLSQNVGPELTVARLQTAANEPWYRKFYNNVREQFKNVSVIWMIALAIALIFDGLTTYVSLDQTPMDGPMVLIFSVLITALFQIADQLVISYRKREFEAEAMVAKYNAQFMRMEQSLTGLEITSESYVQINMDKSKAHSDWKAAEDNRRMARRGRFWSARIADINVIVTAYGFAFLFLNAEEPMFALAQQIDYIFFKGEWESVNLWVFLMVGLAVTVSFVVNTAQRTEILGWSMRRLKRETL